MICRGLTRNALELFWELSSVQFSCSVVSDSLRPHESQHARPPCPSPTPRVHSNSRPLSRWCHPAISSSVIPFFSCPQSLPASESFPMSQLFAWGGQSTGVSALESFLPKNTQGWSPLEWIGWISLQSKGLSRVFSNATVQNIRYLIFSFWLTSLYIMDSKFIRLTRTEMCSFLWASLVTQLVRNPPGMWETWVPSLGWEDLLEKGKATHSSILTWRIPWTV